MPAIYVDANEFSDDDSDPPTSGTTHITMWYMMVLLALLLIWFMVYFCLRLFTLNAPVSDEGHPPVVYFVWYITVSCLCLIFIIILLVAGRMLQLRQKTRNSQQRRTYMGSRQRPSETPTEPTIYVSPANLPPPPKYEAMAPPSYEEVVGIHYPNFQPISQPITTALAQSSNTTETTANNNNVNDNGNNEINVNNENNVNNRSPSVVISVPVVASS
ncbi:hypothetical protein KGM_211716 [Danaus plexippus plexippus]|uniref:Uncharacterized protein n=1 Tax=Danaus plexippus plexippus TaxID=278856 RepID=A0A212EYK1_DANPL|nr:hypothetical protein KGM_211716 [Danaus plexippus plexippus]